MGHFSFWRLNRVAAGGREPHGFWEHIGVCVARRARLDLARATRWARSQAAPRAAPSTGHLTFQQMVRMVDGTMSTKQHRRAVDHLARCEACRIQLAGFAQASVALDAGSDVEPSVADIRQAQQLWKNVTVERPERVAAPPRVSAKNPMTICLLADDSQSVAGEPAEEATESIRDFVAILQAACVGRGSCFRLLLVKFGDFPAVLCDGTPILDVDPQAIQLRGNSGGTDIAGALDLAGQKLSAGAARTGTVPPLVVLHSDGRHTGADPIASADRIKAMRYTADQAPLLVTCGFGDADEAVLKRLASSADHYKRLSSPLELRQFLATVGSSVTSVATEGCSTTTVWRQIGAALAGAA